MIKEKPEHKFFDRMLDNNLDELHKYLTQKNKEILSGDFPNINKDNIEYIKSQFGFVSVTQLGARYNIFDFGNESINKIQLALKDLTKEACDHYGINFEEQDYVIHGWFNFDPNIGTKGSTPMLDDDSIFHDHAQGHGAPDFHGYYCVKAEPSITYYKINNGSDIFENHNIDNRVLVSETGHPHSVGTWAEKDVRITIAYDIMPSKSVSHYDDFDMIWIPL